MADEKTVNVVDPLGNVGSLSEGDAREAMDTSGYRMANDQEIKAQRNEQRFGGVQGPIMAGVLGAARTATLGGSDVAVQQVPGGFTQEQIQGLKDTNPVATVVGELGGILQDPLGIGKLVGAAGKGATAGAKALLTTAKTAEDMSLATKVLTNAVGWGTEGAVYGGITNSVDDYALGDPSVNGEKVMANIGWGALTGGTAGAAFKLLGYGISPALRKAAESLAAVRNELVGSGFGEEALVHKIMPKRFADAIADRQLNLDTRGQASTIKNVVGHLNNATEHIQSEISDFSKDVEKNKDALSSLFPKGPTDEYLESDIGKKSLRNKLAEDEASKAGASEKFTSTNPDMAGDATNKGGFWNSDMGKSFVDLHAKMINDLKQSAIPAVRAQQDAAFHLSTVVEKLKSVIPDGATREKLDSLINKANFGKYSSSSPEDIFNHLKGLKEKVIDFLAKEPMLEDTLKPVADSIGNSLKNPKVFGAAGAATAVHEENVDLLRKFISNDTKQTQFQKTFGEMKNGKWNFDIHKMHAVLADSDPVSRARNFHQLSEFFDHLKEMPDHLLNARKAVPNSTWRKQTISQVIANAKKTTDEAFQDYLKGIEKRRPIYGWKDLAPVVIAKWHPVLAAAIEAYDFYQDPVHAMHELALIERILGKTTRKSLDLIDSIFSPRMGAEKGIDYKGSPPDIKSDKEEEHKKFKKIARDPDAIASNIEKSTKDLNGFAPNISQHLSVLGNQAASFLASKMPTNNDHANPFGDSYKPSDHELSRFDNYRKLVNNPLLALEQIRNRTITNDTIETLSAVYPQLYDELKGKLIEKAHDHTTKGNKIPFQTKQAISMFLGQPVDQALSPQAILSNQMILAGAPKPGQQAQGKVRAKGLDNMGKADRAGADYGAMSDKV